MKMCIRCDVGMELMDSAFGEYLQCPSCRRKEDTDGLDLNQSIMQYNGMNDYMENCGSYIQKVYEMFKVKNISIDKMQPILCKFENETATIRSSLKKHKNHPAYKFNRNFYLGQSASAVYQIFAAAYYRIGDFNTANMLAEKSLDILSPKMDEYKKALEFRDQLHYKTRHKSNDFSRLITICGVIVIIVFILYACLQ